MSERPPRRTLRISSDDDRTRWIDEQDDEGGWSRLDAAEPLRVGETRRLDAEALRVIADSIDHPQRELAEEALRTVESFASGPSEELIEKLKQKFNERVAPSDPLRVEEAGRKYTIPSSKPAMQQFPPVKPIKAAPNPTYEVIELFEAQNHILAEQRDDARRSAAASERHAARSLGLAWAAIGVTVVVGIVQIVLDAIQMAQP